jgi:hypothetical protein
MLRGKDMSLLTDYLVSLAGEPFVYGQTDCALPIGRWWQINHGVDPAEHLRGTYADRDGCLALLARHGSLLRLVWSIAGAAGARRTHDPKPGDFAVVGYGRIQFCAIRTPSGKWALKCGNGIRVVSRCRPMMIWSI